MIDGTCPLLSTSCCYCSQPPAPLIWLWQQPPQGPSFPGLTSSPSSPLIIYTLMETRFLKHTPDLVLPCGNLSVTSCWPSVKETRRNKAFPGWVLFIFLLLLHLSAPLLPATPNVSQFPTPALPSLLLGLYTCCSLASSRSGDLIIKQSQS